MIRHLIIVLACLTVAACADSKMSHRGVEAFVYQEQHQFEIEQKKHNPQQLQQQFKRVLAQFNHDMAATQWQLSYKNSAGKKAAQLLQATLQQQGVVSRKVQLQQVTQLNALLSINVDVYKLVTEKCPDYLFDSQPLRVGCTVESMRLKQVNNPKNLIK